MWQQLARRLSLLPRLINAALPSRFEPRLALFFILARQRPALGDPLPSLLHEGDVVLGYFVFERRLRICRVSTPVAGCFPTMGFRESINGRLSDQGDN